MAKKTALTPEERQMHEERAKEKKKIFGETFLKSLALFLAVVFVYAIAYTAFGQGTTIYEAAPYVPTAGAQGGSASAGGNNAGAPAAPVSNEAAEAAKAINAATAEAEKAGYDWVRDCKFTEGVNVGSATDVLNKVIKGVDKNASIDSVVGGFIGVGNKKVTKPTDKTFKQVYDYHGESYGLKATTLKAEDLQGLTVDGDTYTFKLADAKTPKKDGSTPFSRLTNDIVLQEEVSKEITDLVGGAVKVENLDVLYSNITVKVTITDGKLQELTYSYDGRVNELALKVAVVNVKGTGAIHTDATYSNFVY